MLSNEVQCPYEEKEEDLKLKIKNIMQKYNLSQN